MRLTSLLLLRFLDFMSSVYIDEEFHQPLEDDQWEYYRRQVRHFSEDKKTNSFTSCFNCSKYSRVVLGVVHLERHSNTGIFRNKASVVASQNYCLINFKPDRPGLTSIMNVFFRFYKCVPSSR